jgi:hypothetical protein
MVLAMATGFLGCCVLVEGVVSGEWERGYVEDQVVVG